MNFEPQSRISSPERSSTAAAANGLLVISSMWARFGVALGLLITLLAAAAAPEEEEGLSLFHEVWQLQGSEHMRDR